MAGKIVKKDGGLVEMDGTLGIGGLRGFDRSDLPIPFMKLVQPTSQKIETADGKDAPVGSFYFSRNRESKDNLNIVILNAEKGEVHWEGDDEPSVVYRIIAVHKGSTDPFSFMISGTSRWEFKKLLGEIESVGLKNIYDMSVSVSSEKVEGEKGKWYIMKFALADELSDSELKTADSLAGRFAKEGEEEVDPEEVEIDE